ncbi:hypothetical protein CK203_087348 [Vitis vinifera]|uniref:Uncharacterized protein n=1 Tax=Vitis vinifera TaxID=29760 RepID=A0A438BM77_VITVI|nr:hypothetical protein CK203_087348 [Vitis vinifera]
MMFDYYVVAYIARLIKEVKQWMRRSKSLMLNLVDIGTDQETRPGPAQEAVKARAMRVLKQKRITHSGTPGSNFGTSTNYNLNESWSHDSHGQNQSIQSIKPIETSSRSKSLKSKNERPETLISNVYSRRKTSTITLHVPIFDIVIANENGTQAFDTNVALNLPIAIGKGFRIYTHHFVRLNPWGKAMDEEVTASEEK